MNGEWVTIINKSCGWYHIKYMVTGNSIYKTGYVLIETVDNLNNNYSEELITGGQRYAKNKISVNSCEYFDKSTAVGSIFEGEGLTLLYTVNVDSTNVAYVEYSTSSGTKRGYVNTEELEIPSYPTSVARVMTTNSAYSGPDSSYVKIGGAYYNEFVSILAKEGNWAFVEYNTTSGRKRGFMNYEKLFNLNYIGWYEDFPKNLGVFKAKQQLTVYGGPNSNYANIGTIFNQEVITIFKYERNYSYIEYSTKNGAKRGYVLSSELEKTVLPTIPNIPIYSGFSVGTYGTSGLGKDLKYYKYGSGINTAFIVFEQHGWEDAWAADGIELVKIADRVMNKISENGINNNWTLYIFPYANPDGITNGYTNNGPGRCTYTKKIDMNRSWPANFTPYYNSRNYTGDTALNSPEIQSLRDFIISHRGDNNERIVIDVHGWLNKTYGDYEVAKYFDEQFNFSHSSTFGSGYLETWARSIGAKASLVELPMPTSSEYIVNKDYSGKLANGIINMLHNYKTSVEEGGIDVYESVQVLCNDNVNMRSGPSTSYSIITKLSNGTKVTRIKKSVTTANGYVWDKIKLSDGKTGYVATDYLILIPENTLSNEDVKIVKAYCKSNNVNNFSGNIDSSYGNDILLAIREFQRINELPQTGYVDTATWNAMGLNDDYVYYQYSTIAFNYNTYGNQYGPPEYLVQDSSSNAKFLLDRKNAKLEQQAEYDEQDAKYKTMSPEELMVKKEKLEAIKSTLRSSTYLLDLVGYTHAERSLTHFLDNDGTKLTVLDIEDMFNEIENSAEEKERYYKQFHNAVEYMLKVDKVVNISLDKSVPIVLPKTNFDWYLTFGTYYYSIEATCTRAGRILSATGNHCVRDYYDFDDVDRWEVLKNFIIDKLNKVDGTYDLTDILTKDIADLHYAGLARFYYEEAFINFMDTWTVEQ